MSQLAGPCVVPFDCRGANGWNGFWWLKRTSDLNGSQLVELIAQSPVGIEAELEWIVENAVLEITHIIEIPIPIPAD